MRRALASRAQSAVWAVVVFFASALALVALTQVLSTRSSTLEEADRELARYVSGAEAALNRAFLSVDVLLAGVGELLGLQASAPGWVHPESASAMLARTTRSNLSIRVLAVLDDNGQVLASSDPRGAEVQLQLPEGFLKHAMAPAVSVMVLSQTVQNPASSENVVYVARHLRSGSGEVLVAVAEVPIVALASVLSQDAQIPDLQVVLETGAGARLLTMPPVGSAAPAPAPLRDVLATPSWDMATRLTGAPGRVVARALIYDDLWISAALCRLVWNLTSKAAVD